MGAKRQWGGDGEAGPKERKVKSIARKWAYFADRVL